ncbi:MAG: hypothetical protein HC869_01655 [Rhodospirillales bacterium]|nr:hypothetical protein [Rhodospirillales bacterium]
MSNYPFLYFAHHIFPQAVFDAFVIADDQQSGTIGEALSALFAGRNFDLSKNMDGNIIGLFAEPSIVPNLAQLVQGGRFGSVADGNGNHLGLRNFLTDDLRNLINSGLTVDAIVSAIVDLHLFASEITKGAISGIGLESEIGALDSAWSSFSDSITAADRLAHETFLTAHQDTPSHALLGNMELRVPLQFAALDAQFAAGAITPEQYSFFNSSLQAKVDALISVAANPNGLPIENLMPQLGALSGQISSIGVQVSAIASINSGIPLSSTMQFTNVAAQSFASIPAANLAQAFGPGVFDVDAAFNQVMDSAMSFANSMSQIGSQLPSNLSGLSPNALAHMANSFSSMTVGIGGGVLGDTAEFLNLSYDAIKKGFSTGDWSDFGDAVAQYGAALVVSAVVIGVSVAAASVFLGAGAAAVVAAAWAADGVYDAWTNGMELLGKIAADLSALAQDPPSWQELLEALFNPRPIDPLVIDLDGDGVELLSRAASNAYFDLDADGFAEQTGWVKPDDGILAVDRNGNGRIDDISELFGSATQSGYDALKAFDTNRDGKVNAQDSGFGTLRIWRDLDGDGVSDAGELQSLSQAGITSIGVTGTTANTNVGGNRIVKTGTVEFAGGVVRQSVEVLFDMSQVESRFILPENFSYDTDVSTLPFLRGFGDIPDLRVSMSMDDSVKAEARALIAEARSGDFNGFITQFDGFLADWAGVEDAIWRQDTEVEAFFAYDREHLRDYNAWKAAHPDVVINGVRYPGAPYPGPKPEIKGYAFALEPLIDHVFGGPGFELEEWLEENDFILAYNEDENFVPASTIAPSGVVVGGSGGTVTVTIPPRVFGEDSDAPEMDATDFAFLQKLMGQNFRRGIEFIAHDDIVVTTPNADQVDDLIESFNDVKDYMVVRFLAQAAHSILAEEGVNADLGALAPFRHIFLDPFADQIRGDGESFVTELVSLFRSDSLGSDADALSLLGKFTSDLNYLGAYVAENFTDIPRPLIAEKLGTVISLEGNASSNVLTLTQPGTVLGHAGDDTITASSGADVILGGKGNDRLSGGAGNDAYLFNSLSGHDVVTDTSGSGDRIVFGAGITLANLRASVTDTDANAIKDLTISFSNGTGSVTLSNTFRDEYWAPDQFVDRFEFADGTVLTHQQLLNAIYYKGTSGNDALLGTALADTMSGGLGNDTLTGERGDDRLDGSAGADSLSGGSGNDTLLGADGNDILDGGSGTDSLTGGAGNDSYVVDATTDVIVEVAGGGTDTVQSSVTLTLGTELENLTLLGSSAINGTGNSVANTLTGNAGANSLSGMAGNDRLFGLAGNDTLLGGDGNDTLDGGAGTDSMTGGTGNDTYIVDATTDLVVEVSGGGTDTVQSSVTLTLGADVENLTLTGTTAINGTGNGLANRLLGNSGANALSAGAGNDTIEGGGGNDSLTGGAGADQFVFNSTSGGVDTITDFNQLDGGADEFDVMRFEGLGVGTFVYRGASAFTGGSDNSEARVSGNQVLVDANGDGVTDITITLTGLTSANQLGADDFLFV